MSDFEEDKTVEELEAEQEALAKRIAALKLRMQKQGNRLAAIHLIAVASAFKEALKELKGADPEIFVLNSAWLEIPQQAQPRETNIAKQFDLSETERDNAKEKGRKAIKGL